MSKTLHKIDPEKLSIDNEEFEHSYEIGQWKREGKYNYETRQDTCSLCGCERHMVRSLHTNGEALIASYWRSKTSFGHNHEPTCWGTKNP